MWGAAWRLSPRRAVSSAGRGPDAADDDRCSACTWSLCRRSRPPGPRDPADHALELAKRPYDLRHAGISFWLASGVGRGVCAPGRAEHPGSLPLLRQVPGRGTELCQQVDRGADAAVGGAGRQRAGRMSRALARECRRTAGQRWDSGGRYRELLLISPYGLDARHEGRLAGKTPVQAPFFGVQKNPSFFGEYDTRGSFICWWYTARLALTSANVPCGGAWADLGPGMVRISRRSARPPLPALWPRPRAGRTCGRELPRPKRWMATRTVPASTMARRSRRIARSEVVRLSPYRSNGRKTSSSTSGGSSASRQ